MQEIARTRRSPALLEMCAVLDFRPASYQQQQWSELKRQQGQRKQTQPAPAMAPEPALKYAITCLPTNRATLQDCKSQKEWSLDAGWPAQVVLKARSTSLLDAQG